MDTFDRYLRLVLNCIDMKPDYMIDCMECGSQLWRILKHKNDTINFQCTYCNMRASFSLTEQEMGHDCPCSNDTWNIEEKRDDHVILSCTGCERLSELWLRESKNPIN